MQDTSLKNKNKQIPNSSLDDSVGKIEFGSLFLLAMTRLALGFVDVWVCYEYLHR
jgi:hypothetical protein